MAPWCFPKNIIWLWRAVWQALHTRKDLVAKGISIDFTCIIFYQEEETSDHLLFYCTKIILIWRGLFSNPILICQNSFWQDIWLQAWKNDRWINFFVRCFYTSKFRINVINSFSKENISLLSKLFSVGGICQVHTAGWMDYSSSSTLY